MLQLTESDLNRAKATAEIRALTRFAHRKDGVECVGPKSYPLAQAIADVQSEYRIDPAPAFATVTQDDRGDEFAVNERDDRFPQL
jgi:hypothetical protein